MPFAQLSTVQHRVVPGAALPFDVRDADGTLLLARGQCVQSQAQLQALLQRGATVDLTDLQDTRTRVLRAPRAELPGLWRRCLGQIGDALRDAGCSSFPGALDEAAAPVQALVERDPDLAIFHVLHQSGGDDLAYGARRSLQTAITSVLVAQRLGWEPQQAECLFKVALTMNVAMLELQGQLARQGTPPTAAQRGALQSHPMRSVRMLELAGVNDAGWLTAVLQHHEQEDGSGYPSGTAAVDALASLARRADAYTAKLAARSGRAAMAADLAGRQMFMQDPGHPMTAALVREFGIYPPGCYVRLASGEVGIVVARGSTITAPVVACLTNERGAPLAMPTRRDTVEQMHAVVGVVGEGSVSVRLPLDRLAALVTG